MPATAGDGGDIPAMMAGLGDAARTAARALAQASPAAKNQALTAAADALQSAETTILEANQADLDYARKKGVKAALVDRLVLNPTRLAGVADGLRAIAQLDDPVGQEMAAWMRPNGLAIARVRVPLGVIGIIYESRPNVTADAGGLCLKAGNAA
ncbi:MAG: gamma-glutamyl-phosphate reductase, partial [Pseudomonadota bacterium]|nr:gamma-glutamyl-phosphate reductase [Pseudomonadota bacterium]